jgi:L-ascorbate metabolism protein UlaG (beta-lactamase superfamily)
MDISYLGHASFRIKGRDATLITDPFDPKSVGLKFPKTEADIVTISHGHSDHNFLDNIDSTKMIIDGPGEYEIMDVSVIGIPSYHDDKKGELRGRNTIYVIEMDSLRIAHLGDLGHILKEKDIDAMGDIDVLMIPVGGEYTINANQAAEVARSIEAKIIIPMHFQTKGLNPQMFSKLSTEDAFLADLGLPVEKDKKLKVKSELLGEEQKIVVLEI